MSTHMPGFQSFLRFLLPFVLAKLANSSTRVRPGMKIIAYHFKLYHSKVFTTFKLKIVHTYDLTILTKLKWPDWPQLVGI